MSTSLTVVVTMASGRLPGDFWPRVPGYVPPGADPEPRYDSLSGSEEIEEVEDEMGRAAEDDHDKKEVPLKKPASKMTTAKAKSAAATKDKHPKAKAAPKLKSKPSRKVKGKPSPKLKAKPSPKLKAKPSPKVKAKAKASAKARAKAKASAEETSEKEDAPPKGATKSSEKKGKGRASVKPKGWKSGDIGCSKCRYKGCAACRTAENMAGADKAES